MSADRATSRRMQDARALAQAVSIGLLAVCTLVACSACGNDDSDAGASSDAGARVDSGGEPGAGECMITAPTECPDPALRYADVEPIFQDRCVGCHVGVRGGPWALTSYMHAAAWFAEVRGAMLNCTMPPLDAGIEMPDEERERILTWIRCGYPE